MLALIKLALNNCICLFTPLLYASFIFLYRHKLWHLCPESEIQFLSCVLKLQVSVLAGVLAITRIQSDPLHGPILHTFLPSSGEFATIFHFIKSLI